MAFAASLRTYLSGSHLETARFLASEAARHEAAQMREGSKEVRFLAVSAVLSSVAFLEAQANELYIDAAEDNHSHGTKELDAGSRQLLKNLCPLVERTSVLDKFQTAVRFLRHTEIDRSARIWDHSRALIGLRNYLVHYKPETAVVMSMIEDKPVDTLRIEKQVAGKFATNPWYRNSTTSFFTSHLSAGCASWASDTALALTDEFYRILGVSPPYAQLLKSG